MSLTVAAYSPGYAKVAGLDEQAWTAQGETRGRVNGTSAAASDTRTRYATVGDVERPVLEGGLSIPVSATLPAAGWEYEVTAVGADDDPSLLGRRYRVVDVPAKSNASARRLDVVEV